MWLWKWSALNFLSLFLCHQDLSSSVLIYWQVRTCPECGKGKHKSSFRKCPFFSAGALFKVLKMVVAYNCIFACHNHQSFNKKLNIEAPYFDILCRFSDLKMPTMQHFFWLIWTINSTAIISWQAPKKAKFSIWAPKLTLAVCFQRILPRRSTRQKIIHQVPHYNAETYIVSLLNLTLKLVLHCSTSLCQIQIFTSKLTPNYWWHMLQFLTKV